MRVERVGVALTGTCIMVVAARGVVLFALGTSRGRDVLRDHAVARSLQQAGLATLLLDPSPEGDSRVDDELLAQRLFCAADWLAREPRTRDLALGLFGASSAAGAALVIAASRPDHVAAVVSRGGRPDLASAVLEKVRAPTLLIVGRNDPVVLKRNKEALGRIGADEKELQIVPGATHSFGEAGALEQVSRLAADWFTRFLGSRTSRLRSASTERA